MMFSNTKRKSAFTRRGNNVSISPQQTAVPESGSYVCPHQISNWRKEGVCPTRHDTSAILLMLMLPLLSDAIASQTLNQSHLANQERTQ
jgi:hypothetical protein